MFLPICFFLVLTFKSWFGFSDFLLLQIRPLGFLPWNSLGTIFTSIPPRLFHILHQYLSFAGQTLVELNPNILVRDVERMGWGDPVSANSGHQTCRDTASPQAGRGPGMSWVRVPPAPPVPHPSVSPPLSLPSRQFLQPLYK